MSHRVEKDIKGSTDDIKEVVDYSIVELVSEKVSFNFL